MNTWSEVREQLLRIGTSVLFALFGLSLLGATPALAGVGLGTTPTFPPTVVAPTLGIPAALQISWFNTGTNATHANNVTGITLTPACGEFTDPCPAAKSRSRKRRRLSPAVDCVWI